MQPSTLRRLYVLTERAHRGKRQWYFLGIYRHKLPAGGDAPLRGGVEPHVNRKGRRHLQLYGLCKERLSNPPHTPLWCVVVSHKDKSVRDTKTGVLEKWHLHGNVVNRKLESSDKIQIQLFTLGQAKPYPGPSSVQAGINVVDENTRTVRNLQRRG